MSHEDPGKWEYEAHVGRSPDHFTLRVTPGQMPVLSEDICGCLLTQPPALTWKEIQCAQHILLTLHHHPAPHTVFLLLYLLSPVRSDAVCKDAFGPPEQAEAQA